MKEPLLIGDPEGLRRKLRHPSPRLGALYRRFQKRLADDVAFRKANIFLEALMEDPQAVEESRRHILDRSRELGTMEPEDPDVELRAIYCWGPSALRMAVYHQWLERLGAWSGGESEQIARHLIRFCHEQMVSTLRSRTPTSNNQSLSMGLTCAVVGEAFACLPPVASEAQALKQFGLREVESVFGFTPADGYCLEGSTYQSDVFSPLMMFAAAFLKQDAGDQVLDRPWLPHGGTLRNFLGMESLLPSPGLLLPPWDHYGWQEQVNLAAIACHASLTGQHHLLHAAEEVWDRKDIIAWAEDDRMWTLVYWPEEEVGSPKSVGLGGWTLPGAGAVVDNWENKSRLMLVWDRCSDSLQGFTRYQTDPNHVVYEIAGVPIFGDGVPVDFTTPYLGVDPLQPVGFLSAEQKDVMLRQNSNPEQWARAIQGGAIGSANTVYLDGEAAYCPLSGRQGQLCFEQRTPHRHVVTAESLSYYKPRYDLTRARRTVAAESGGISWIVDDFAAQSIHTFTWQVYVRRDTQLDGNRLFVRTPEGPEVTLIWISAENCRLETVETFPKKLLAWPEEGSKRLRMEATGRTAHFAVCLLPWIDTGAVLQKVGDHSWEVNHTSGRSRFTLPEQSLALCDPVPDKPITHCDLEETPFHLSDQSDETLLDQLRQARLSSWRETTRAMQTLAQRNIPEAWPLIHQLLTASAHTYHVYSVAAWCLGHGMYRPALEDLRVRMHASEPNLALRARWAVERMEQGASGDRSHFT
ncbi:MAG: hypothetical protein SFY92_01835 [Verrucomicrobiae bacterium]|nr:hypothetical protein [Verrucomicrobiae bacterium]